MAKALMGTVMLKRLSAITLLCLFPACRPTGEAQVRLRLRIVRFVTSPSTAYDPETSLLWQRNSPGPACKRGSCAVEYCDTLELEGLAGWRLPTSDELGTLLPDRDGQPAPGLDPEVFPGSPSRFWTSTAAPCAESTLAVVDFRSEAIEGIQFADFPIYIRCVHSTDDMCFHVD
ncbi:MAG: DUF1566 domain-containing protein [Deltaproteobacteria bacterium]|nr:DUF1566 domain-containing protein [Deltaproteobacteria bacterium]